MLFNSILFLFFFAIVGVVYFAIPHRFRWILLLIASYGFYMSLKPGYVVLVIVLTLTSYYAGLQMGQTERKSRRKKFLIVAILANLGFLFLFKYYDFFNSSFKTLFSYSHPPYDIPALHYILPVGISFYTFKSLSYAMDVYRGDQLPEKHLGYFALYVAFFPQLLAGPIERAARFLPQLYEKFDFDCQRVARGLKLMLWGLFQKMVIADNLATLVDSVYNDPTHHHGISLVLATLLFAFQIYCDFSGYSDIAIGAAQVLGFATMDNFNRPYFSKSVPEFWRRWHISLSTWFRDYLYFPMGGNRVSIPRWYFNLFVVMLICGFWHGANWTFLVWGGLHGIYLVLSAATKDLRDSMTRRIGLSKMPGLHRYSRVLITFSIVCFAWIFFRANSLPDALYIITHLPTGWESLVQIHRLKETPFLGPLKFEFMIAIFSVVLLLFVHSIERQGCIVEKVSQRPVWLRWSIYYSVVLSILLFGNFGSKQFIYFQF
jgi:D-alanyl-lipoteichoic acid acyltransferase DltB (MBOAT superfamily)